MNPQIKEYFERGEVNQSLLKTVIKSLDNYKAANNKNARNLHYEEKGHLVIGGAVDTWITEGYPALQAEYHVAEELAKKPSDSVKSILNYLLEQCASLSSRGPAFDATQIPSIVDLGANDRTKELLLSACANGVEGGWNNRYSEDKKIEHLAKGEEYWKQIKAGYGKTVISSDEFGTISAIANSFLNWSVFLEIIQPKEGKEVHAQLPVYFTLREVACKALMDFVVIDFNTKTVYIYDVKTTTFSINTFHKTVKKYRYDFQIAFYSEAIRDYLVARGINIAEWSLQTAFLVESTNYPGNPCVIECPQEIRQIGLTGRPSISTPWKDKEINREGLIQISSEIKGIYQALEMYRWYIANDFSVDYDVAHANQHFVLKWDATVAA